MRKWLFISPLILLAACARTDRQAGTASTAAQSASAQTALAPAPAAPAPAAPVADAATAPAAAPAGNPEPVEREAVQPVANREQIVIPGRTAITVRLDETIDTKRNRAGDVVHATLTRPVVVRGET